MCVSLVITIYGHNEGEFHVPPGFAPPLVHNNTRQYNAHQYQAELLSPVTLELQHIMNYYNPEDS